jgi:hypothetical protein
MPILRSFKSGGSLLHCRWFTIEGGQLNNCVPFENVIRCATTEDAEPLLRVRIPSQFLVFHGEARAPRYRSFEKPQCHKGAIALHNRGECSGVFRIWRLFGILHFSISQNK